MYLTIYLKFGADATLSAKQAMLVTPYDSRKNILTSTATLFKFPINRTIYVTQKEECEMLVSTQNHKTHRTQGYNQFETSAVLKIIVNPLFSSSPSQKTKPIFLPPLFHTINLTNDRLCL